MATTFGPLVGQSRTSTSKQNLAVELSMSEKPFSRRQFLAKTCAGLSSAWFLENWPAILAAQEHARRAVEAAGAVPFEFFSPAQAAEVEAVAAQIVPSDSTPGAREAGVIYFIDRALKTFASDNQKVYSRGLEELGSKLRTLFPGVCKFSEATPEQQMSVLKEIEKTEFFGIVRTHTVMGFLASPDRGGNQNQIGWKLIGFEDQHVYEPPFGYYDRDYPGWEAQNPKDHKL